MLEFSAATARFVVFVVLSLAHLSLPAAGVRKVTDGIVMILEAEVFFGPDAKTSGGPLLCPDRSSGHIWTSSVTSTVRSRDEGGGHVGRKG